MVSSLIFRPSQGYLQELSVRRRNTHARRSLDIRNVQYANHYERKHGENQKYNSGNTVGRGRIAVISNKIMVGATNPGIRKISKKQAWYIRLPFVWLSILPFAKRATPERFKDNGEKGDIKAIV